MAIEATLYNDKGAVDWIGPIVTVIIKTTNHSYEFEVSDIKKITFKELEKSDV